MSQKWYVGVQGGATWLEHMYMQLFPPQQSDISYYRDSTQSIRDNPTGWEIL